MWQLVVVFSRELKTADFNDDNDTKDTFEGPPVFSDEDLEDSPLAEEEYRQEHEMSAAPVHPGPLEASLREERRSRRVRLLLVLLCFCAGMLVLVFFLMMRPEEEKPQFVRERITRPIESAQKQQEPRVPRAVEEKEEEAQQVSVAGAERAEPQIQPQEEEKIQVEEKEPTRPDMPMVEAPRTSAVPEEKQPPGKYTVNVASFRERRRAERLMNDLKEKGYDAFVTEASIPQRGTWYRVAVGRFPSVEEAQVFAQALKEKENLDFFVRKLKKSNR